MLITASTSLIAANDAVISASIHRNKYQLKAQTALNIRQR
jgi:hypothetical protein